MATKTGNGYVKVDGAELERQLSNGHQTPAQWERAPRADQGDRRWRRRV